MSKLSFFLRRFHSLIALIPLGIFVFVQFMLNSSIFLGNEAYMTMVNFMKHAPFVIVLELVLIAIPLIFHGLYGIYIVYLAKNNALQYKYYRNVAFYLQRITSLIMLAFLVWHVYTLRIAGGGTEDVYGILVSTLQDPVGFILYVVGIVASIYHLTNGIFTFCITWGICVGDRAQKFFATCAILLFVVMSIWAVGILLALAAA